MLLAAPDASQVLPLLGSGGAAYSVFDELHVAANGVERRAQLMAHHAKKFRFELARFLGIRARRFQRVLRFLVARQQLGVLKGDRDLICCNLHEEQLEGGRKVWPRRSNGDPTQLSFESNR